MRQNNDESLIIENSNEQQYQISPFSHLIIQFKEKLENQAVHEKTLESIANKYFDEASVISSRVLTKKTDTKEQFEFYLKHPLVNLKLLNETSFSFIILIPNKERVNFSAFIQEIEQSFENSNYSMAGLPYLNYEIGKTTLDIKKFILPGLIALTLILSLFLFKSLWDTIVFFHFPLISIAIAQLLLKGIYGESNLLSSLSPLINFVVILCLNFHLYYSLKALGTISELKRIKLKPILFMLITTIIGLSSLCISDVPAIRAFSIISSLSLFIASVYNLLIFAFIYSKNPLQSKKIIIFPFSPPKIKSGLMTLLLIIPFILAFFFIKNIPIQVEALYFFPKNSKIIKASKTIEKEIIGTPILEIDFDSIDLNNNYEKFKSISLVEERISKMLGDDVLILSKSSLIKEANYIYSGKFELPDHTLSANALLTGVPIGLTSQEENDKYKSVFLTQARDTEDYRKILQEVRLYLDTLDFKYQFSGIYYRLMKSQTGIIDTLIKSFLISLFFVSILVGLMFNSIKDFLIFLLINIIPPLLTLVVFKIIGMSLNLATILTFSVSFGLIVDSTIHIIYGKKIGLSEEHLNQTVYSPMIFSSFVLMLGFLNFTFHSFLPIWQFGLSMFFTILFGFLYDFFVLPNLGKKS